MGIVKSLYDHVKLISSNNEVFANGIINIVKILLMERLKNIENKNYSRHATIPYLQGLLESLKRIGNGFNGRAVFQTRNTLRAILSD